MPSCIFCAAQDASGEARVWPAWLESDAALRTRAHGSDAEHWAAPGRDLLVRGLCEDCAGGWITALHTKAEPLLGAMLADETVSLAEDDQRTLGAWALLQAIMCALGTAGAPLFPAAHVEGLYHQVTATDGDAANPAAPPGVSVDLFRYGGERWTAFHRAYPLTLTFGGGAGPPDTPAYGITFTVGRVGFQLFGVSVADLQIDRRDSKLGRRLVRQIWPFRRSLVWPITPALDDDQLIALADSFAG